MLSRNSNGITVSGLAIIVDNGGGSFSLVDLKVYGCMVKDQSRCIELLFSLVSRKAGH